MAQLLPLRRPRGFTPCFGKPAYRRKCIAVATVPHRPVFDCQIAYY
jgi:hypothetical protein